MTTTADTTAEQPGEDAEAQFAAWLANIAAHADDPRDGQIMREILDDDPQAQRELFYFEQILLNTRPQLSPLPTLLVLAILVPAAAFLLLRWLL